MAIDDDLKWCVDFDNELFVEAINRKIDLNEIILAEVGNKTVGYLRLEYWWSQVPYIGLIRVEEKYRGRGIGRTILAFLEDFLRSRGYGVLYSSSQVDEPPPQAWHRKMGFVECGIITGM